jgi:hypothetical protein
MIYCIGNSHACVFRGKNEIFQCWPQKQDDAALHFKTCTIGPTIASNFYKHHLNRVRAILKESSIKDTDFVMLVVGEVDCRWHIPKQAELQQRDPKDVCIECVDRFFRCYDILKNDGYNLLGWAVHPSTNDGHNDDLSCPVYGDVLYRNIITRVFNNRLRELCEINEIKFIDISENFFDELGKTRMEFFLDYCHLDANKVMPIVIQECKQLGIF